MFHSEHKLAFPKSSPLTEVVSNALQRGGPIKFSRILGACNCSETEFIEGNTHNLDESRYVIYQTSVFLTNAKGEIAVFHRHKKSHSRNRITEGKSILISESSATPPWQSVARLVRQKCSFGKKDQISGINQVGCALNMLPNKDGHPQPTYLMCIHEYVVGNNRLNGLNRLFPDTFVEWSKPEKLERKLNGYVDRALARSLESNTDDPVSLHDDSTVLNSLSRIVDDQGEIPPSSRDEVLDSRGVFVSHAGGDWFLADLVSQFLAQLSKGLVFPMVDLHDLEHGKKLWPQIKRLIRRCDCVLVIITPFTKDSTGVKTEVEYALNKRIPVIGLMVSASPPGYLSEDLCYDLTKYRKTLGELDAVIDIIRNKPFRN